MNEETIYKLLSSVNADDRKIGEEFLESSGIPDNIKEQMYIKADRELRNHDIWI